MTPKEREAAGAVFVVKAHLAYVAKTEVLGDGTRRIRVGGRADVGRMVWKEAVEVARTLRRASQDVKILRLRKRRRKAGHR